MGNHRDHAIVIVWIAEYAFLFKTVYQCHIVVRCQCLGGLAGDGVGIGIEDIALAVMGQRSHYWGDVFFQQCLEHLAVGTFHIAYKAEVDSVFQWALMTVDDIHIGSCQT